MNFGRKLRSSVVVFSCKKWRRYETEKLSKHQFASKKSWLGWLRFMLNILDILILKQTFGDNREISRILAVNSRQVMSR